MDKRKKIGIGIKLNTTVMKWKEILTKKRNETLILLSILLMIAMIGYMHKKHLSDMEETVTAIYEDRLVAKDYVFFLTKTINTKKLALNSSDELVEEVVIANHTIDQLLVSFENTKLTSEESALFLKLKDEIDLSFEFESQIIHNPMLTQREMVIQQLNNQYDLILADLEDLSEIQLYEGKRRLESSNKVMASNRITSRLEIALLIVVVLVFLMATSSPKVLIQKDFWHS